MRPPAGSLGRPEHRQDRLADRWGQRWPGLDHSGQIAVDWSKPVTDCSAFCSACSRFRHTARRFFGLFDSRRGYSTTTHVVALTRMPLQNRGFLMRGQTGLRPGARQYGGLLQRILQRFGEVVIGDLEVVLRRHWEWFGSDGLHAGAGVGRLGKRQRLRSTEPEQER